jgi:hypothetical protein
LEGPWLCIGFGIFKTQLWESAVATIQNGQSILRDFVVFQQQACLTSDGDNTCLIDHTGTLSCVDLWRRQSWPLLSQTHVDKQILGVRPSCLLWLYRFVWEVEALFQKFAQSRFKCCFLDQLRQTWWFVLVFDGESRWVLMRFAVCCVAFGLRFVLCCCVCCLLPALSCPRAQTNTWGLWRMHTDCAPARSGPAQPKNDVGVRAQRELRRAQSKSINQRYFSLEKNEFGGEVYLTSGM